MSLNIGYIFDLVKAGKAKIFVLAPHPDDFDSVSVTLREFFRRGNSLYLAVMTEASSGVEDSYVKEKYFLLKNKTSGESAKYIQSLICENPDLNNLTFIKKIKALLREAEQLKSCEVFGLNEENITFLRLREDIHGDLVMTKTNQKKLFEFFAKLVEPDKSEIILIFMPHYNDSNPTHVRAFEMISRIIKDMNNNNIFFFLNRDPKTIKMNSNFYVYFNCETEQWKRILLRIHDTQQERNFNTRGHGFDDRIIQLNKWSASGHPDRIRALANRSDTLYKIDEKTFILFADTQGDILFAEEFEVISGSQSNFMSESVKL